MGCSITSTKNQDNKNLVIMKKSKLSKKRNKDTIKEFPQRTININSSLISNLNDQIRDSCNKPIQKKSLSEFEFKTINFNTNNIKNYFKNQKPPSISDLETNLYTDDFFPPNNQSLFGLASNDSSNCNNQISNNSFNLEINFQNSIWLRANEIFPDEKLQLYDSNININLNFEQDYYSLLGNNYFYRALYVLAKYPQLIGQIFKTYEFSKNSCYEIALKINGEWKIVLLDDYFPCDKQTKKPIFAKSSSSELWIMLLEKAWAKLNAGYIYVKDGSVIELLSSFTPFQKELIIFNDYLRNNKQEVYKLKKFEEKFKKGEIKMHEAHFHDLKGKKIFELFKNILKNLFNKVKKSHEVLDYMIEFIEKYRIDKEFKEELEKSIQENKIDLNFIMKHYKQNLDYFDENCNSIKRNIIEAKNNNTNDDKFSIITTSVEQNFLTFCNPINYNCIPYSALVLKSKSEIALTSLINFEDLKNCNLSNNYLKKNSNLQITKIINSEYSKISNDLEDKSLNDNNSKNNLIIDSKNKYLENQIVKETNFFESLSAFEAFITSKILNECILWELFLANSLSNNQTKIIYVTSIFEQCIINLGLIPGYSYSLLGVKEAIINEKKIRLLFLSNLRGKTKWLGPWSDNSTEWTEEAKKAFTELPKRNQDYFAIQWEDFLKFFLAAEVLYIKDILCTKIHKISIKSDEKKDSIFEINLLNKTEIHINIVLKNNGFNKKIPINAYSPFRLILCKYEPISKNIYVLIDEMNDYEPLISNKTLEAGSYIVLIKHFFDVTKFDKETNHIVEISANNYFGFVFKGFDSEGKIVENIIEKNRFSKRPLVDSLNKNEINNQIDNKNEAENFIRFDSKNILNINTASSIKNCLTFNYSSDTIPISILPNDKLTLEETNRIIKLLESSINLSDTAQLNSIIYNFESYNFIFRKINIDFEQLNKKLDFRQLAYQTYKNQFPNLIKEFEKFTKNYNETALFFKLEDYGSYKYLGYFKENEPIFKQGAGIFIWEDNVFTCGHIINNKLNGICHEHINGYSLCINYTDGVRNGIGDFFYPNRKSFKVEYKRGILINVEDDEKIYCKC